METRTPSPDRTSSDDAPEREVAPDEGLRARDPGRWRRGRGRREIPPPDPESARAANRLIMHFVLLMLAALVTMALPLPWQAAALAFVVGAIVVGVRALRAAWRPGLRERLAPLLIFLLGFATLLALSLGLMLAFWPVQIERQQCLARAVTISAREACDARYQEALNERLEELTGRSGD